MSENKPEPALEAASSFQTLLSIVEKTLDGFPVWGPKAVVTAAGEVLRITRLKKENDNTIKDVQNEAQNVLSKISTQHINEELSDGPITIRPDLQKRIDRFRGEIEEHLHELDSYRAARSSPRPINLSEKVKRWLAVGAEVLAAEEISKALPEVNRKISVSIQNFMLAGQIKNEMIGDAVLNQVARIAGDVKAIRHAQGNPALLDIGCGTQNISQSVLSQLYPIKTALHNAEGAPRSCHQGTRAAILDQVKTWFQDPKSPSILWLSGIAGTGKTAIAQSICELLAADLGASFLFSRDFAERRRPSNILPTIAYQLAYSRPILHSPISEMLLQNPDFVSKSVQVQAQELLFKVLGSDLTPDFPVTLLVLDALDECDKVDYREGENFIPSLLRFLQAYPSRFKVVITSRPEKSIRRMLEDRNGQTNLFVLHDVDRNVVQSDIETYLRHEFAQIAAERGLADDWPDDVRERQAKQLAAFADRLFIFATTIVKALAKSRLPSKMIQELLKRAHDSNQSLHAPLDDMYLQVVTTVIPTDLEKQEAEDLVKAFQHIVGAIVTLEQPLDFSSLGHLLNVEKRQLHAVIGPLYAVLDVDNSLKRPIQVFHLSFPDFLIDEKRCRDPRFQIVRQKSHSMLSACCLRIMNQQLKHNMCKIEDPGLLNVEVEDLTKRRESYTSAELRYACSYWWAHLKYVEFATEELVEELHAFTSRSLLGWIELLSLMGRLQSALVGLPKAIEWCKNFISSSSGQDSKRSYAERALSTVSIKYPKVTSWYQKGKKPEGEWPSKELTHTAALLYDANRIVETFFRPISESALQVYETALTFMPDCLLLSQSNKSCSKQVKMASERRAQWSQDLRVLEGHKDVVTQVVVSPNGSLIASHSRDKTIRLWDLSSGTQLLYIASDSHYLSFSPDSLRLLSLTKTLDSLQTWDVVSGDILNAFPLHLEEDRSSKMGSAQCGVISPSGDHVAIGLKSGDLYMFGVDGTATRLQGHTGLLQAVVFSRDGLRVVSGSDDHTIRIWDTKRQSCVATFHVHRDWRTDHVYISPDGLHLIVLAEFKNEYQSKVWVWNIGTQQRLVNMKVPYQTYPMVFSVSETCFACPSDESETFCIYDLTSGRRLALLKGHARTVSATAFSPDGSYIISGSDDSTIRIWDARLGATATASLEAPNSEIRNMVFSADGTKLITTFTDETVCCWDTRSGRMKSKVAKSAHRVGFSAGGKPVALFWKLTSTIHVWNAETGKAITTLPGHSGKVYVATFSPDFVRLASGSADNTVRIWSTATWECAVILLGHTGDVNDVRFSPDGGRVVSGSDDKTVRVWDAITGSALAVLEGHTDWVRSVRFSPDGLSIISEDVSRNEREWKAGVHFPISTSASPLPLTFHLDGSGWLFVVTPITGQRRRICWLPIERRGIFWSSSSTIALGSSKGAVTILSVSDAIL